MKNGQPSETARVVALMRAAHMILDDRPWVFEDAFAAPLSGIDNEKSLLEAVRSFQTRLSGTFSEEPARALTRHVRSDVTLRARYVEDELAEAIGRGVSQYVILGAGFDSFAYRRRDLEGTLRIFEVDYPATQERKRARLRDLGVDIPPHVTFVPLDFEQQAILDGLRACGYRADEPAFFSWLGVTWYLTEDAIADTLRQIASTAAGSEIVLQYALRATLLDEEEQRILAMLRTLAADYGEPLRTEFEPAEMVARVKALGFSRVWDLGAQELNARYLVGRNDTLRFPGLLRLMKARVE